MFYLSEILKYDNIIIQCHDYPDADTLASAFAVYTYLYENGKAARMVYAGRAEITKPNLLRMITFLSIPLEYVNTLPDDITLIMTDCQYEESNVTKFDAKNIIQLDHHEDKNRGYSGIIRSNLGSCATLIWDLLLKENFPFDKYPQAATALYYGLYTDTNSFEEISHPLDKDMRDELIFNKTVFNTLRFNNLTIEELNIAGMALTRHKIDNEHNFAIFQADACDPNILGFISDLTLQVEDVDVCIVYSILPNGYKISIRSCTREIMADEFAAFLASGGGHKQKAGAFVAKDKIGDTAIDEYLWNRTKQYFGSYDTIYADSHGLNISVMPKYKKRIIPVGYVPSTDIFPKNTPILIRTLEGDSDVIASEDILFMIGFEGEVYPIKSDKFNNSYTSTGQDFIKDFTYSPTVKNKITGETIQLIEYAKSCIPTGQTFIYASQISKNTKLFNSWNPDGYMLGIPGDYLAVRADSHNDVYIIKNDIFVKTYDGAD